MELELESDTVEDGVVEHIRLQRLYTGETGLGVREWKKVREHMLATGECDPEDIEMMNNAQRWWVNEVKLGMRGLKAEDPVIN